MQENIRFIQIFGERNSGTNYLEHLIRRNFRDVSITWKYGWKHWQYSAEVAAADDCLFLVMHRDPFSWLKSMHHRPHHAAEHLCGLPFEGFVSTEWRSVPAVVSQQYPNGQVCGAEIMEDRHPQTGERFRSILELRSVKIRYWMNLRNMVRRFASLNYEELQQVPQQMMLAISRQFGLPMRESFAKVDESYGVAGTRHRPTQYTPLTRAEIDLVVQGLDEDAEKAAGYDLRVSAQRERTKSSFRTIKKMGAFSLRQLEACKTLLARCGRKVIRGMNLV